MAIRREVAVVIELNPKGKIVVHPRRFWVHKSAHEEVKWFCSRQHRHGDTCFIVDFLGKSPFHKPTFNGHHAHSGYADVKPNPRKLYKYSVTVGKQTIDPDGGVKP